VLSVLNSNINKQNMDFYSFKELDEESAANANDHANNEEEGSTSYQDSNNDEDVAIQKDDPN
jgi:hypothetical protein